MKSDHIRLDESRLGQMNSDKMIWVKIGSDEIRWNKYSADEHKWDWVWLDVVQLDLIISEYI